MTCELWSKTLYKHFKTYVQEKLKFEHENQRGGQGVTLNATLSFRGDTKKLFLFQYQMIFDQNRTNLQICKKNRKKKEGKLKARCQ